MTKVLLFQGQPGASAAVAVSASSATRAIDAASVVNPTATDRWLSVWLVQSGDSVADDVIIYHEKVITAGTTAVLAELINQAIPQNATIHMQAEAAASLTVLMSGQSE